MSSISPTGFQTIPTTIASETNLDQWFKDILSTVSDRSGLSVFQKRILAGELRHIPPRDQKLILAFVNTQGILSKSLEFAKSQDQINFVKELVEMGAEINDQDEYGKTILNHVKNAELYDWLIDRGAHWGEGSMLGHLIQCAQNTYQKEEYSNPWIPIFKRRVQEATVFDFSKLTTSDIRDLVKMLKSDRSLQNIFKNVVIKHLSESSEALKVVGVEIAKIVFSDVGNQSLIYNNLEDLIKEGFLKDPLIEWIFSDEEILKSNTREIEPFFEIIKPFWIPSNALASLYRQCGQNFLLTFWCNALLRSSSLESLCKLFETLERFATQIDHLHSEAKQKIVAHIENLQICEKSTVWLTKGCLRHSSNPAKTIEWMLQLGFDPHWKDLKYNRTLLFSEFIYKIENYRILNSFDINHRDVNGDNALEFHCKNKWNNTRCYRPLSNLGLTLGDQFPNIEICRKTFPDSPYLQVILGACLLDPKKKTFGRHMYPLSGEEKLIFNEAVTKNEEIHKILGKWIVSISSTTWVERPNNDYNNQDHFNSLDLQSIMAGRDTSSLSSISLLGGIWKTKVPTEALKIIPQSPLASLFISALKEQHRTLPPSTKPIAIELITCDLSQKDMLHLNGYIFDNPDIMAIIVQDYFKVKEVNVEPNGGSTAKHGKTVYYLINQFKEINHLPTICNRNDAITKAFKTKIPPAPIDMLNVPQGAQITKLGRTAVVRSESRCEAFKFLKEGENYEYFAQEYSVTQAFNNLAANYRSRFIKPIGLYIVRQLPPELAAFKVKPGTHSPEYVFHYEADPDTFVYLQDAPIEKYPSARLKCLHDAVKMVKMGIYPDLAAMFHNNMQNRKYVFLLDLLVLLRVKPLCDTFTPAGGAGRLDQFESTIQYPNMRASGLTDMRDATILDDNNLSEDMKHLKNNSIPTRYYLQMNALANVLLIDMLLLSKRYKNEGNLQWNNEQLMELLGRDLAHAFAHVTATYSESSEEKSLAFALNSGIDWTRAARQIAFWQDISSNGYPSWVVRGEVPKALYEMGVRIRVDIYEAINFDPIKGFSSNGSQDIGPYNGPLALTEFEKAMHLLFVPIALAESLHPKICVDPSKAPINQNTLLSMNRYQTSFEMFTIRYYQSKC